jgi:ankyrin repeat protein
MIQPYEMKLGLPMDLCMGQVRTDQVWEMLTASYNGDLDRIKQLNSHHPSLVFCKYNYTPPIHLAVREGHTETVSYLLEEGALQHNYATYPFLDSLSTIAADRNHTAILVLLQDYLDTSSKFKFKKDWSSPIYFQRTEEEKAFERAIDKGDIDLVRQYLQNNPRLALDETFFWGEGVMMMAAKEGNRKMVELLMSYNARIPDILKWTQFYYFKQDDMAAFLLENGMNPNVMSWHHVTVLHDMAQKGELYKAGLLIKHGAEIDAIEEEYQSSPLGLAARWGQGAMVSYLLKQGADANKAGAEWSTPMAWARKKGFGEIEKILRNAGAK